MILTSDRIVDLVDAPLGVTILSVSPHSAFYKITCRPVALSPSPSSPPSKTISHDKSGEHTLHFKVLFIPFPTLTVILWLFYFTPSLCVKAVVETEARKHLRHYAFGMSLFLVHEHCNSARKDQHPGARWQMQGGESLWLFEQDELSFMQLLYYCMPLSS